MEINMSKLIEKFVKDALESKNIKSLQEVEKVVLELLPSFNSVRSDMAPLVYLIYANRHDYFLTPETDRYVKHFQEYLMDRFEFARATAYNYTKIAKTLVTMGKGNAEKLLKEYGTGLITYLLNVSELRNIKKNEHTIMTMDPRKIDNLLKDQAKPAESWFISKQEVDGLEITVIRGKPEFMVTIDCSGMESKDVEKAFKARDQLLKKLERFTTNIKVVSGISVKEIDEKIRQFELETAQYGDDENDDEYENDLLVSETEPDEVDEVDFDDDTELPVENIPSHSVVPGKVTSVNKKRGLVINNQQPRQRQQTS
jgi:hypothetical protein